MRNYIIEKQQHAPSRIHGIEVSVIDKPVNKIDFKKIKTDVENKVPKHFFNGLNGIKIIDIKKIRNQDFNATYDSKNKIMYLSNKQDNEKDVLDDIFHELAHHIQDTYKDHIFSDGKLRREFMGKRMKLFDQLSAYGMHPPSRIKFSKHDFDDELDYYFYKKIGYKKLDNFTNGLFLTNYSCSSLYEYFAEGVEQYLFKPGLHHKMKSVSPTLFKKVAALFDKQDLQ